MADVICGFEATGFTLETPGKHSPFDQLTANRTANKRVVGGFVAQGQVEINDSQIRSTRRETGGQMWLKTEGWS
jgi:hypothetical protein